MPIPRSRSGPCSRPRKHEIGDILRESIEHESKSLALYQELLSLLQGESVMLEEYARKMVFEEEQHLGEVDKMLRQPGDIHSVASPGAAKHTGS
jgi:bacterioferritin